MEVQEGAGSLLLSRLRLILLRQQQPLHTMATRAQHSEEGPFPLRSQQQECGRREVLPRSGGLFLEGAAGWQTAALPLVP